MNILDEIFAEKRKEVARRKELEPLARLQARVETAPASLDFRAVLRQDDGHPALIAEVKCASPSRGRMVADFDPLCIARTYAENGAAAISVLTDERYFNGRLSYLPEIAAVVKTNPASGRPLPLLRKDFIFDPYQVYEARCNQADAILLIVAALDPVRLSQLDCLARELGMAALVEVHDESDLKTALDCGCTLIGINNRNLRDFTVDLDTTRRLRPLIPDSITLVAESGIRTPEDAHRLGEAGMDAILVGEALVTAPDLAKAVRSFVQP